MKNEKLILMIVIMLLTSMGVVAQEARFAELSGTVEVKSGAEDWQPAAVGGIIATDTVISTGIKSSAVISLGASTVTVNPLTMLTLEELVQRDGTEEAVLFLRTGRVKADVTPPSGQKAEFTVRSPTTTASVRGTSFSFNGRRLSVHSGRVQFANQRGQKVYVNTSQNSHADTRQGQRLALPFDAGIASMRPTFGDLENTGSQKQKPQKQTPQVNITLDWL